MTEPAPFYRQTLDASTTALKRSLRTSRLVGYLRLLLAGIGGAIALLGPPRFGQGAWIAAVIAAVLFGVAVSWHARVVATQTHTRRRIAAANSGLARMELRWDDLPPSPKLRFRDDQASRLSRDLAIGGEFGLMRLLDVTHAELGVNRALEWLTSDALDPAAISLRQQSVVGLRDRPQFLLEMAAEARHGRSAHARTGHVAFKAWSASRASGAITRPLLPWMPFVTTAVIVIGAVQRGDAAIAAAILAIAIQLVLSGVARRRINEEVGDVEGAVEDLRSIVRVATLVTDEADVDGALGVTQRSVRQRRAVEGMAGLVRLLQWNEVRHSPMGHWAFNALIAFDVHVLNALHRWIGRHTRVASELSDDVAEAEAITAFGTLAFEHPRWCVPALYAEAGAPPLRGRALAHPLLAPDVAVPNDIDLERAGVGVVVSGPNMAGKTTFLRTVGLNLLLAQAGSVVCAESMEVRLCRVRTCVRVEDDLRGGMSLFLAEVTRLRDIIADAEDASGHPVFFLLDEILHGTNSHDRRVASRLVLQRLIDAGAVGLVTTHDPEIAVLHGVSESSDGGAKLPRTNHMHFDGSVSRSAAGEVVLEFDYRAKAGPATRTNALLILEALGIKQPQE